MRLSILLEILPRSLPTTTQLLFSISSPHRVVEWEIGSDTMIFLAIVFRPLCVSLLASATKLDSEVLVDISRAVECLFARLSTIHYIVCLLSTHFFFPSFNRLSSSLFLLRSFSRKSLYTNRFSSLLFENSFNRSQNCSLSCACCCCSIKKKRFLSRVKQKIKRKKRKKKLILTRNIEEMKLISIAWCRWASYPYIPNQFLLCL